MFAFEPWTLADHQRGMIVCRGYDDLLGRLRGISYRKSYRGWSSDPHERGLAGEIAFAEYLGFPMEWVFKNEGDYGVDRELLLTLAGDDVPWWVEVDIKCSDKPGHLLVDVGKCSPHRIYVNSRYIRPKRAQLLGWCWGSDLMRCPSGIWKEGTDAVVYQKKSSELRDLAEINAAWTGHSRDEMLLKVHTNKDRVLYESHIPLRYTGDLTVPRRGFSYAQSDQSTDPGVSIGWRTVSS